EVSAPEATRTGNSVPGAPSSAGTVTFREAGVVSRMVAGVLPNWTLTPAPHPAPARTTSSPGIATAGEMPWMRGASNTATVPGLDSCPSTTTTTGTGVSRPSAAAISGISTSSRVGEAWTTRPGLSPKRTTFSAGVAPKCVPAMVTLWPSPTRGGVIDWMAGVLVERRKKKPAAPATSSTAPPAMRAIGGDDLRPPLGVAARADGAGREGALRGRDGASSVSGAIDGGGVGPGRRAGRGGAGAGAAAAAGRTAGAGLGGGGAGSAAGGDGSTAGGGGSGGAGTAAAAGAAGSSTKNRSSSAGAKAGAGSDRTGDGGGGGGGSGAGGATTTAGSSMKNTSSLGASAAGGGDRGSGDRGSGDRGSSAKTTGSTSASAAGSSGITIAGGAAPPARRHWSITLPSSPGAPSQTTSPSRSGAWPLTRVSLT